jgi:hypothetical protein
MNCPKCESEMRKVKIGTGIICRNPFCKFLTTRDELRKIWDEKDKEDIPLILRFNRIEKIIVNKIGIEFHTKNQWNRPYIEIRKF